MINFSELNLDTPSSLSVEDKHLILSKFFELPPLSWLIECESEDQEKHWRRVKFVCEEIHAELSNYFQGRSRPEKETQSKQYAEPIAVSARLYIDLYNVIFYSFNEIKNVTDSLNIEIPKEPGKYLCLLIENEMRCMFAQCLSYTEYNPRKVYKLSRDAQKIKELKEKINLTSKEKILIQKHETEVSKLINHCREQLGLFFITMAVAKKSKVNSVKNALRRYEETSDELSKVSNRLFHPSKGLGVTTWNKGKLS